MDFARPNPDDLLKAVQHRTDHRGRLKIFLGASAGVGKTFAMLSEAHEQLKRGVDIVGGIWKVERADDGKIKLRHAQRGCAEEVVSFAEVLERMRPYFEATGSMIDQAYQPRLDEGITRVYMIETKVGGFGHQAINALFPAPTGADPKDAPQPGPRLYFPPDEPQFQPLGKLMESLWVHELQSCLGMTTAELPLLWDADLMLGPKDAAGNDTYVLCEINVSCVSPYPEWANPLIASTLLRRINLKLC